MKFILFQSCFRFLRYQKEYKPPEDLYNRIDKICEQQQIPTAHQTKLDDPLQRYNLFLACEQEFQHPITNSVLYSIRTISKFFTENFQEFCQFLWVFEILFNEQFYSFLSEKKCLRKF